ncbi:MAG TPA: glucose-6-phosphate dehydrogenase [Candidatus Saccharimonadales bacterium]|nr:glucose-6-phosphate dehydrogenase [Candidatus Saccharimonadales bacterium]
MSNSARDPSVLVIFGITGDLAKRKVLPALYHLIKDDILHEKTMVVGTSRRPLTTDQLLEQVELCVLEADNVCDPAVMRKIREKIVTIQLDPGEDKDYSILHTELQHLEDKQGVCLNRLFYLSIPPSVYGRIVAKLGEHKLNGSCKHGAAQARLLVEKPFGFDLTSAQELIRETQQSFTEEQVFRIDHYLAKQTVQNILTFRQCNAIFNESWDARHIHGIEVVAYEKIGIEGRADFYEQVGALRDIVQSHLLQLLALTTMELPQDLANSTAIHAAKLRLLDDIAALNAAQLQKVIRAQYEGYREEVGRSHSMTETFVSLTLAINNKRWESVPVRISTGKALERKHTAISIDFGKEEANRLTFRLQPNEGIDIELQVKKPGYEHETQTVRMDFSYGESSAAHPDAYERVLLDAVRGDHTLFATADEVLASWRILQPVISMWGMNSSELSMYRQGSNPSELLQ